MVTMREDREWLMGKPPLPMPVQERDMVVLIQGGHARFLDGTRIRAWYRGQWWVKVGGFYWPDHQGWPEFPADDSEHPSQADECDSSVRESPENPAAPEHDPPERVSSAAETRGTEPAASSSADTPDGSRDRDGDE